METLTAIKPFIDCIIEVVTLHRCPPGIQSMTSPADNGCSNYLMQVVCFRDIDENFPIFLIKTCMGKM